jgi:hypothetical protein
MCTTCYRTLIDGGTRVNRLTVLIQKRGGIKVRLLLRAPDRQPGQGGQHRPGAEQARGDTAVLRPTFAVAYGSVLPAWHWFLARTGGRPIILVGDSQGSAILIHLISAELDHEPSVLRRLVVVVLAGGNLRVPAGKTVGATFTRVPLCTSASQTGCAIAFSSYPAQPPADSQFGRPGQGVSLQSGQTATAGQQVAGGPLTRRARVSAGGSLA